MRPRCSLAVAGIIGALAVAGGTGTVTAAPPRDCGAISFSGTQTRILALRGVSCAGAKRVARTYDRRFRPPRPWLCGLAHAPFTRIAGRRVGFSCGWGGGPGDLRKRPHAFVGTIR